jgi:hypothetical protein
MDHDPVFMPVPDRGGQAGLRTQVLDKVHTKGLYDKPYIFHDMLLYIHCNIHHYNFCGRNIGQE